MRVLFALVLISAACGKQASLSDAPLAGDGAGADSAVTPMPAATLPDSIDLGAVGCGDARRLTFIVQNTGTAALTYSVWASPVTFFKVDPHEGSIEPGGATTFTVEGDVADDGVVGKTINGSLLVTSNLPGDDVHTIQLTMVASGAVITLTPPSANFGDVELSKSALQTITIKNEGNATAGISLGAPADARYSSPSRG